MASTVLSEFDAHKVEVKDPDTGEFIELLPNASGYSEAEFEGKGEYQVRVPAVKYPVVPFRMLTDDGRTILVPSRHGSINVASIEKRLATENKVLVGINGMMPSVEKDGWSASRYDLAGDMQMQVGPKPGAIKVASAYPAQQSSFWQWWRRLVSS
ncbi:hypothetical protein WJX72_000835 [[Myrmecia] bisecta]|uniref:Uncharacterized protein n=1 Tax=[Myrmecia] bisecta TaxID=41462 RepID=A0AAW1PSB5_9CHLO